MHQSTRAPGFQNREVSSFWAVVRDAVKRFFGTVKGGTADKKPGLFS
jgi:hypothetical protein